MNNSTLRKISFLWVIHVLERLYLTENVCAGFLVTLCDCSKEKTSVGLLFSLRVRTEHVRGLSLQTRVQETVLQFRSLHLYTRALWPATDLQACTACGGVCAYALPWNFQSLDETHAPKRSRPSETQATARSPRGQKAGAVLSPPAGRALILAVAPPERSESRRSDLGEFSAGNCSGSLALSSLYPSGLPAMMTALLALNCLTEHEGWFQLAPARGRARCACTAKICGSLAVGFKGGRTKSLGAAPCITNSRNSLWFPLRAIRELYIVLCLELKILVSKTNPVLHHRIHLIFARG